jgi:hypothetical protein
MMRGMAWRSLMDQRRDGYIGRESGLVEKTAQTPGLIQAVT